MKRRAKTGFHAAVLTGLVLTAGLKPAWAQEDTAPKEIEPPKEKYGRYTEIAWGETYKGDLATDANYELWTKNMPYGLYTFVGHKGQQLRIEVHSPGVFSNFFVGTSSVNIHLGGQPALNGRTALFTVPHDDRFYIFVTAHETKANGKPNSNWMARGQYTLTVTDLDAPAPEPVQIAEADPQPQQALAAAPVPSALPGGQGLPGSGAAMAQPVAMPAPKPVATAKPVAVPPQLAARWGDWATLGGTSWIEDEALISYEWVIPGEQMKSIILTVDGEFENQLSLSATGDSVILKLSSGEYGQLIFPRPGIVIQQFPNRPTRTVMRFNGDTILMSQEAQQNGIWVSQQSSTRRRASSEDVSRFGQMLLAKRQETAAKNAAVAAAWGDMAKIVNKEFIGGDGTFHKVVWEDDAKTRVKWNRYFADGRSFAQNYTIGKADKNGLFPLGGQAGYEMYMTQGGALLRGDEMRYHPMSDGTIQIESGKYQKDTQTFTAKKLVPEWQMKETEHSVWLARLEQAQSRYRTAQAANSEKKSGGGGLFGTLIGAAVGGAGAAVADLNATDTIGLVMKGAAATTSDGGMRAALDGASNSIISGGGGSSALSGMGSGMGGGLGAGPGATTAGSYPTKPNLASGACPGFTEGNYRQRALQGGPDAQLYTLCGGAFEYYHMYKNAIAQGYSEADANRTYAAHEAAAMNAQSLLN